MSLIPDFELGLWNAWIFMLYVIFSMVLPYLLSGWLIDKKILEKLGSQRISEKEGTATDIR